MKLFRLKMMRLMFFQAIVTNIWQTPKFYTRHRTFAFKVLHLSCIPSTMKTTLYISIMHDGRRGFFMKRSEIRQKSIEYYDHARNRVPDNAVSPPGVPSH